MLFMTIGDIFCSRVERIAAGGAGITRLPAGPDSPRKGKAVFLEMTAPDDLVRYRIAKDHGSWAEGEPLEIVEPSPLRTDPACPLYGRCGGCSLQHMRYEAQIEAKKAILTDAFTRIAGLSGLPALSVRGSAPYGYRNRVRFHASPGPSPGQSQDFSPGFMERKSSRLVTIEDCPVADQGIRKALGEKSLSGGKRVYSKGDTFLCEGGTEKGRVSLLGRDLALDVKVFFQGNAAALELLVRDLLALEADRSLPLADVYCGVGTFSAFLGGEFPEIELVEENQYALALARENMPPGKKVRYRAMKDSLWVSRQKNPLRGLMALDPPREGLSGPLREWLAQKGPGTVAYVSCDPATLARDSKTLLQGAYALRELFMYDFYPQTAHVESLAVFSRK
jgi:23S rRNA (uracil1939-C5)-methyltransferase